MLIESSRFKPWVSHSMNFKISKTGTKKTAYIGDDKPEFSSPITFGRFLEIKYLGKEKFEWLLSNESGAKISKTEGDFRKLSSAIKNYGLEIEKL